MKEKPVLPPNKCCGNNNFDQANKPPPQQQTTQQRLDTALAFLEDENFIAASEELSRILIADPNNQNALILSAKTEAAQGNGSAAVKILDSLDNTDPALKIEMLWLAAGWSIDSGDYSTAEQKLKELLGYRHRSRESTSPTRHHS